MKKFLLIPLCFISLISVAQTDLKISVKAGLSSAHIQGEASDQLSGLIAFTDGILTTQHRTGFYAGTSLEIPISQGFSFEPGLYYAQKGYSLKGDYQIKGLEFVSLNAKATLQNDYIEMPLLAKLNTGPVSIFAGPQFAYLASSKLKTTAGVLGANLLNKSFDVSNQFNAWDASVLAGIGIQITQNINLQAAYDFGLSKIDANKSIDAYNRTLKIGMGINF